MLVALLVVAAVWAGPAPGPSEKAAQARAGTVSLDRAAGVEPASLGVLRLAQFRAAPGEVRVEPPPRARKVLIEIQRRGGKAPPGYVGGRRFRNRERRLPPGVYRENDVHPRWPGRDRGPERIVIEQGTGKAYYTGDHYRTFVPLSEELPANGRLAP